MRALALLVCALGFSATEAAANSRVCRQIEAQLAASGSGGGSSQYKKYDNAVTKQRNELSRARSNARQSGCTFSLFGGKQHCGPLNTQIERMERNLEALQRKRTELAGGGGATSKRERQRILASIASNGCRDQQEAASGRRVPPALGARSRDGASLFDRLFGGGVKQDGTSETVVTGRLQDGGGGVYGPAGRFRTLCVRTCDGYFFPMSAGSSGRDFDRDLNNCQSMCPGTDVKLYYHDARGEESEQMVSVATGEPYMSLPTAFQYKEIGITRPADCGCNPTKGYALLGDGATPAETAEPVIPVPVVRPDPATDPETLANAEGGLDEAAIRRLLKPKPVASIVHEIDPADRKVRVVGPVFLPDQEGAIDLRAPAQKTVQ